MAPRDYKQRTRRSAKKTTQQRSPWLFFAVGMLVGVTASVLVYFNEFVPVPLYVSPQTKPEQKRAAETTKADSESAEAPKPRFEFYTLLPEMEVAVPDVDLKPGSPAKPSAAGDPGTYYLQAGSFRLPQEADKMKASLAFLGLESSIQTVAINGADTWHRVRIGPFGDLASLNEVRRQLIENKIESSVLKVRG